MSKQSIKCFFGMHKNVTTLRPFTEPKMDSKGKLSLFMREDTCMACDHWKATAITAQEYNNLKM